MPEKTEKEIQILKGEIKAGAIFSAILVVLFLAALFFHHKDKIEQNARIFELEMKMYRCGCQGGEGQ